MNLDGGSPITRVSILRSVFIVVHASAAILAGWLTLMVCPWVWHVVDQQQEFCAYPFQHHHFPVRPWTAVVFAMPWTLRLVVYVIIPVAMASGVAWAWWRWPREQSLACSITACQIAALIIAPSLIATGLPYWTMG